MIKKFDKKSTWDAKYVPNFRVVHLIGSRQLEVSNPMGRTTKVNICDAHQIEPVDHISSSTLEKQVFGQRGKYINDPRIIKCKGKVKVLLLYSTARPDSFSSTLQPYP